MKKYSRLGLTLLAGTGVAAISTPLAAKDITQPSDPATATQAPATPAVQPEPAQQRLAQSSASADIVVTGSRIIRNGNNLPTPVTVVPVEQILSTTPTTVSEALNTLPQFGGSQTSTSGPGSGIRNGSAAFITVRNAGDNHTLVLWDGHRVLPASPQESHASDVDLNLIPQMLLRRVDIVTGGASAIYGADAVSGVVNFITDTDFTGLKVQGSYGISTYNDAPAKDFGIAFGSKIFGDRGHIEASYEFRDDKGILDPRDKYARNFFARVLGGAGQGTTASPYISLENVRLATATSFGGRVTSATGALAPLATLNFTQDNTLLPFNAGTVVQGIPTGSDGAYYYNASLKSSLRMHKFFGRFDYDLSDNLSAYVQGSFSKQRSQNYFQSANVVFDVGLNNPYLDSVTVNAPGFTTAQFQALRAANPNGTFRVSKFLLNQEAGRPIINEMEFGTLYAGLDGKLGDYRWNVHVGRSWADQDIRNTGNIDLGRFYAAVDTVRVGGSIVCRAASVNPNYAGCVPLNPFGPTSESQAALDFVTAVTATQTHVKLDEIQATFSGAPFSTWAGPVQFALTGEYHRTTFNIVSPNTPEELADCVGIRFSDLTAPSPTTGYCNGPLTGSPTLRYGQNTLSPLQPGVSIKVLEAAAEAEIPLARDVPFAKDISVNLAGRYTDYSSTGGAWTWKVGAIWQVTDDIRFRGSFSKDIRAPNLYELYSPPTYSFVTFNDIPVAIGGSGIQGGFTRRLQDGNPNLKNEKAETLTGGFIFTPRFLPGFSFAADYWRIRMKDTILQIRGFDNPVRNICIASGGTSPYCSLYIRPGPNQFPTLITQLLENLASQETWGIDYEANYSTRINNQPFSLRVFAVMQPKNEFNSASLGILDIGGSYSGLPASVGPSPKWRATAVATYNFTDALKVSVMERWRGPMRATSRAKDGAGNDITPVYAVDRVPDVWYTNLTVSYTFPTKFAPVEIYGNVQNLFNTFSKVPVGGPANTIPSRGLVPMPAGDDPIGRYFQVGFRMKI